jgi:hypothetical protein
MRNYPAIIFLLYLSAVGPAWAQKMQLTYDHVGTVQYLNSLQPSVTVTTNHGDAYCYSGNGSVDCYSGIPTAVTIVTLEKGTPHTIDGRVHASPTPYLNGNHGKIDPLDDAVHSAIHSRSMPTKHYDNLDEAAAAFKEWQEQPMIAQFQYRLVKDYKVSTSSLNSFSLFKSHDNNDNYGFCVPSTVKDKHGNVKKQTEVCYPL